MSKLGQRYIFPFHTPLCSHAENFISLGIITTKIILKVIPVLKTQCLAGMETVCVLVARQRQYPYVTYRSSYFLRTIKD